MIKDGGLDLLRALLSLYNDVIRQDVEPPSKWKSSMITVIFKDGDPTLPSNYRPITLIPILYKLFSRLLRRRLEPILEAGQCEDQAGFRHGYSIDEHLLTFNLLQERCEEWGQQLWVATVDFKKAFDSINHEYMWQAL